MKRRRFTKQPAIELCDLYGVPRPLGGDKKELRGSTETSRARGACSTERRSMPRMLVAKISPRSASRNTLPQLIHKRTKPDKCIRCHFESFWGCNAKSLIQACPTLPLSFHEASYPDNPHHFQNQLYYLKVLFAKDHYWIIRKKNFHLQDLNRAAKP